MTSDHQLVQHYVDACLRTEHIEPFAGILREQIDAFFAERPHGRTAEWEAGLKRLPVSQTAAFDLAADTIQVTGTTFDDEFENTLKLYKPWRKGPFQLGDIFIDTEWRSDWKWQRIRPHISPLTNRHILDIGCGNGYHLFRMLGDGAASAVGVDPTRLFLYQFHSIRHFLPDIPAWILPLRSEHLPSFKLFDTVFSLGVLYHRRSPIDHLTELLSFLRPGGELVLETLIVDGDENTVLVPEDRYAKMANVWFLPSTLALENWLARAGFKNIRTVDINQTSIEEQRATEWMDFHSLEQFLDPNDHNLTAEGLPAPKRATVIAEKS